VDLREANDPSTCLSAIAQALRLPAPPASNGADEPSAIAWLARRSAGCSGLLVLDNAEHMQAPVAAVVDALCRMPCDLRLLVTSRHRLETADAWELTLRGLDVVSVDDGETGIGPAVWLFGSRAALADPAFRPVDMPPSVETICRRLDGLPLALELAAARVPLLGVDGVVQALDSQLSAFVDGSKRRGDRHVSLLAVLEWSASLLDRDEQALLAALAVLQGSFTLVDAASVAGFDDHWHFTACFDGLRRKSLVFAETVTPQPWRSGTPTGTTDADSHDVRRWRMLESTRQFALLRLRGSGRETAVLHRHAETFAAQAQALHQRWLDGFGPEAAIEAAMERLIGNGAAALDWCCGDGRVLDAPRAQLAARILTATARAFHHRGLLQKARRWGMAVGRFWLEDAAGPSVGAPRLSPLEEAHLRLALAILRPPGFVSSASRVAQLRRAGELLDGLDAPGLTVDVQLTFAILAARAGQPQVALDAVAAARRALPAPAPARLRACVAEAQMRLAVLQGLGSAPEDALVEEILADLEAAGDGNSRVAVYLRIEQAERLLLAGRHRAAMRALAALCDDFSGGRYGWEVWLAPFDALAHAQLRSRDMNGAAESLRRSFMMAEMSGYWGELGAVTAWYLCTRGRHRASMELHGATEAYLSSIGHAHDRLQSTALDEALTLARSACRSADITRWRAEGRARGPQGLPQMLGQGDGRFSP
jgi:predicted ATPase